MQDPDPTTARRAMQGMALGALAGLVVIQLRLPALFSFWDTTARFVVVAALAGALAAAARGWRLLIAVTGALSGLWLVVAFTPLVANLAPGTERFDADESGDAVFVFSSGLQVDGEPTSAAMARMHHGLELVSRGRAPLLVVSETGVGERTALLARRWMTSFGVRADVLTVGLARDTHDEAVLVAALAKQRGLRRILAVTSPTHARRACATLEHEGLTVVCSPGVETRFDLPALGRAEDRIAAFPDVMHDLIGYRVYRLRGWVP
jgi:uncharacterized SAM-binding protein YcdF (DUF218 family)